MDQESILQEIPTKKLFKPMGIYIATFFGGPLVAGYLISSNYQALDEKQNVTKTWIFTIFGTVIIIFLSYLINYGSTRDIPGFLLPLIYSTITYNIVNLLQKQKIATYISAGGQFHPTSRVFLVTIVGVAITIAGLLIIVKILGFVSFYGIG